MVQPFLGGSEFNRGTLGGLGRFGGSMRPRPFQEASPLGQFRPPTRPPKLGAGCGLCTEQPHHPHLLNAPEQKPHWPTHRPLPENRLEGGASLLVCCLSFLRQQVALQGTNNYKLRRGTTHFGFDRQVSDQKPKSRFEPSYSAKAN